MAGASVTVDDAQVKERLQGLLDATGDLTPAWRDIGEYLMISTRHRFRDQRAPDGTAWAPLSPVTRKRKKKNKDLILVLDGYLRDSIHYEVSPDELVLGTNRVYAAAQQFGMPKGYAGTTKRGAPIPWGNIPARPFLGFSEDDRQEVLAILGTFLERAAA